jgi:hypothetical protein
MALVFWVIVIVWALLGIWSTRTKRDYFALGNAAIEWILFVIIGVKLFGWPS